MNKLALVDTATIEKYNLSWACVDTFDLRAHDVIVCNTDISGGPGIHWIVLVRKGADVLIMNPLGPDDVQPNDAMMIDRIRQQGFKPRRFPGTVQLPDSTQCGWFAIFMAKGAQTSLAKGYSLATIEAGALELWGRTADVNDLRRIDDEFDLGKLD